MKKLFLIGLFLIFSYSVSAYQDSYITAFSKEKVGENLLNGVN